MAINQSFYERQFNPFIQAGGALAGVLLVGGLGSIVSTGPESGPNLFAWQAAAAFMLVFAVFNAIFSATTAQTRSYFQHSMLAFTGLLLGSVLLAYLYSGVGIREAGSYFWIFIVLTFGYLVFIVVVTIIRRIIDFAQREEWNQPRKRRGNRR